MRIVSKALYIKRRLEGRCVVSFCPNKAYSRKGKTGQYCTKCTRVLLKEKHPYTYWYDLLRSNAVRRKVPFLITKDEFIKFCVENNYLELKGRGSGRATIDRKKNYIGYTYDNIQILEHNSNSKKVWIDKKLKEMYDSGQEPSQEELDAFKNALSSFGNEIELYKPKMADCDF